MTPAEQAKAHAERLGVFYCSTCGGFYRHRSWLGEPCPREVDTPPARSIPDPDTGISEDEWMNGIR